MATLRREARSAPAETVSNGYGGGPGFTHVISADGSRVFWTYAPDASLEGRTSPCNPVEHRSRALYVRENDTRPQSPVGPEEECLVAADACTVQVNAAVGGGGIFQGASADGSKVFFTKGDLYEYDLETGQTTDLSPGVEVKGVAGISENGEYVYYVDSNNDIVLWHAGVTTLVAKDAANSSDYVQDGALPITLEKSVPARRRSPWMVIVWCSCRTRVWKRCSSMKLCRGS